MLPRTLILVVFAFTYCAVLPGCNASRSSSHASPDPGANLPHSFAELRAAGIAAESAGRHFQAFDLYTRAVSLQPNDAGIQIRLAYAAVGAHERQTGLDSVRRLREIRADAAQDPDVQKLQATLESLPKRSNEMELAVRTARSILWDLPKLARKPHEFGVASDRALDALAPYLADPDQNDLAVWRMAGLLSLARSDDVLAAFAFEAIARLEPDYLNHPDLSDLMVSLNKRPIAERVRLIPEERTWPIVKAKLQGDADTLCLAIGIGVPKLVHLAIERGEKSLAEREVIVGRYLNSPNAIENTHARVANTTMVSYSLPVLILYDAGFLDTHCDQEKALALLRELDASAKLEPGYEALAKQIGGSQIVITAASLSSGWIYGKIPNGGYLWVTFFDFDNHHHPAEIVVKDKQRAAYWAQVSLDLARGTGEQGEVLKAVVTNAHDAAECLMPYDNMSAPYDLERARRLNEKARSFAVDEAMTTMLLRQARMIEYYSARSYDSPKRPGFVRLDLAKARSYDQKDADLGDPTGMFDLGACFWNGSGGPKNQGEAIRWWKKAATAGSEEAQLELNKLNIPWH